MDDASFERTLQHISRVQFFLSVYTRKLIQRAFYHDRSKLHEPERSGYALLDKKVSSLPYGSEERKQASKEFESIIQHHYSVNSHHPEYYNNKGIDGMNLLDLVEMYCDWKAASERGGNMYDSIRIGKKRFNMSDQLYHIFMNTEDTLFVGEVE